MEQNQVKPSSNLVWAILTTLCCCLPFGIVSIVYASKVNGLYAAAQYAEAQAASANAKKWAIIAAVVGAIVNILVYVLYGAVIMAAMAQ